ncbi:hypothetical protein C8F04DRAFT_1230905 [Mycena alexandri]|uniref:Uncharacterized protein n=1 Tax=Mycena alexandri TaxID=1745969 RepID=A0AAD6T702_9AGAR|nr:hypothetical protein C8F04DRAFT_1230905 [Mycena alexandri]
MGEFILNVEIDDIMMPYLKQTGNMYNLCVAKKVGTDYNVVWSGNTQYLAKNKFQFEEQYQVFGGNKFGSGALVEAQTEPVNIAFGEVAVLQDTGVFQPAKDADNKKELVDSASFAVNNDYQAICIGVNGKINGKFLPIYLSRQLVTGSIELQPKVEVMVWFSNKERTSSMIMKAAALSTTVDFTGHTTRTIRYTQADPDHPGKGKWIKL